MKPSIIIYKLLTLSMLLSLFGVAQEVTKEPKLDFPDVAQLQYPSKKDTVTDLKKWIGDFDYIKVMLYDHRAEEKSRAFYKDRVYHKGLLKDYTLKLTKNESKSVVKSITGRHAFQGGAFCYAPHHAFVFYDSEHKVLGHIEICFMCGTTRNYPEKGLSLYWDKQQLRKLVLKNKIPLFNTPEEWKAFFTKHAKTKMENKSE